MTLDLNQLYVESFETSPGAPELMRTTRPVTEHVQVCAIGTLALVQAPAPTENPEYC
jgi:hypothetical protein